jgi:hypothetical protein
VDRSPLAREPGAPGPHDPRAPPGAGTRWCTGCQNPKRASGSATRKPLGLWDPRVPLGVGTRGLGWAPVARTQMPPDNVTLL